MFTPIAPQIKEKIIELHLAGQGRNSIDRELRAKGIRVSHGSISNIINRHKREHEQSLQPRPSSSYYDTSIVETSQSPQPEGGTSRVTTSPVETLAEKEFKNKKGDIDLENHVITQTQQQSWEENGYPHDGKSLGQTGAPLSWFIQNNGQVDYDARTSNPLQTRTRNLEVSPTKRRHEDLEEEEENIDLDWTSSRPKFRHSLSLQDSDLDESLEINFLSRIMEEKQLRRQEIGWILEQQQENAQAQNWIDEQSRNLKSRENVLQELESYIPLARQFQSMNIDITVFLPLIDAISQYAAAHNTDLTTATFDITNKLQAYRNLDAIYMDIEKAKQRLSMFGEQKQKALTVLMSLMDKGITESQIALLATDCWHQRQYQQSNGNIQQSSDNNGYGGDNYTMTDYLRLNLLKGSTTNMLNKMTPR